MASKSDLTQNKAMNWIGKLEEFDKTRGDWTAYIERVEQYFLANDVSGGSSVSQNKLPQLILGYFYIIKYLQSNFIG